MFKKINYLVAIALIIFGFNTQSFAQEEDEPYKMWESIMLTPDNKNLKTLSENMRAHNQKYHAVNTKHQATVFTINSGPNAGKIVWEMGPIMFSDLDTRPEEEGHDEDWRDNIMPYIKKMGTVEYWSQMEKLSHTDGLTDDQSTHPLLYLRYFEVAKGQGYSLKHLLEQMSAAVKAMDSDVPWGLYDNQLRQGLDIGRHISWVAFYKNWTDFDNDSSFKEAFVKVHGEGAWDSYLKTFDATFSNSWDEIWVYSKELSGH